MIAQSCGCRARSAWTRNQSRNRIWPYSPPVPIYGSAQPAARDVLLVIEVADSTLRHDREVKLPLYARHGIPEAWLVDLQHQQLHICRFPGDGSYRDCRITREPGVLEPVALPGVQLDLGTLLAG